MSLRSTKHWIISGALLVLMTASAFGQGMENMQWFAPPADNSYGGGRHPREGFFATAEYLRMSISSPDATTIGYDTAQPHDVYTEYGISRAARNSFDTAWIDSRGTDGMRYEIGDIAGHSGWMVGGYTVKEQGQQFHPLGGGEMIINDPDSQGMTQMQIGSVANGIGPQTPFGLTDGIFYYEEGGVTHLAIQKMPVVFDDVTFSHSVRTWSLELNYVYRAHPFQTGGILELFGGVRYMEFDDVFGFNGRGTPFAGIEATYSDPLDPNDTNDNTTNNVNNVNNVNTGTTTTLSGDVTYDGTALGPGSIFHDASFDTQAENHITGPQLGFKYSQTYGSWTIFTEGRFFAGFNRQNMRQQGVLGSQLSTSEYNALLADIEIATIDTIDIDPSIYPWIPIAMNGPLTFNHSGNADEWSPAVEFRLGANWQLTDVISLQTSYDMIWVDNVARASGLTQYTFDGQVFGLTNRTTQDVLMNAFSLGVTLNR